MYDYPLAPSSSTPPSPRRSPRKQHNRRSQSPLPHLSTLLPTTHSSYHHEYSPASRAADISRLLDPAYASSSSSSSTSASPATPSSRTQTRAYVDHNGDLHDPDYRDFPVYRPSSRNAPTAARRRTSTGSAARPPSREQYTKPSWERDWGVELDESDDEHEDDEIESQSHVSPFASHHGSPRKSSSVSAYAHPSYTSRYYYFPDVAPTSSPQGSYESDNANALQLHGSPFGEDEEEVVEETRRSSCLVRKGSKPKKSAVAEAQMEKDEEEPSPSLDDAIEEEHASTPTCTHALRKQWQAVSLRVRFGVFHAKRRIFPRRHRT